LGTDKQETKGGVIKIMKIRLLIAILIVMGLVIGLPVPLLP